MKSLRNALIAAAVLGLVPTWAGAQEAGDTHIGPVVGINSAKVVEDDEDSDSRTGFLLGIQGQYALSKTVFLRGGLAYSMRGGKESEDGETWELNLDYVELPILLGYAIPTDGQVAPFGIAGLQLGYNVKCQVKYSYDGESESEDCDDDEVASTDLGLVLGGGVSFLAGTARLSLDARYVIGLQSIDEEDDETKNRGFTFTLAYMLPVGSGY